MRAMKVTAAGQVLLDDVQTSPGVYKHCHAGLDHFWECLPELDGGLEWGQLKWCPAASGAPQNGKQALAFAGLQTKSTILCQQLWNHAQTWYIYNCISDFSLMKPWTNTSPGNTFSRQWALPRHRVMPSASAEEQMEGKSTCNRDDHC